MFKKAMSLAMAMVMTMTLITGCNQQSSSSSSASSGTASSAGSASSQGETQTGTSNFPESGELTFVIPYSDSSGTNTVWRAFGAELEKVMGVKVIYDNRDGASGAVGTTYFLNQPHDGTYIL